jgi:hypothetical protein
MSFRSRYSQLAAALLLASAPSLSFALGQQHFVKTTSGKGDFPLVSSGHAATILVDKADFPGVLRAANDLQSDIERVTALKPQLASDEHELKDAVVLIGTIGKSPLIDSLIGHHKLDVGQIKGKWESTLIQVVDRPFPGVSQALVIAGSDKRGTIFGIYDLSEQIGVSPWYWWADVPVTHQDALFIAPGRYLQGEPAVRYRGIFLNDEAPSLTGWVNATYGGYNHKFYTRVFELLLRLKANYLWPAMWNSAFNEDDPDNARLADEYGIVMGTSHHEPMLRAQQEWKRHGNNIWDYSTNAEVLDKFWAEGIERNKNFESTITLGMRGDGDMPMTEGANIALLEKIVADQRRILAEHNTPTLASNPKVWALYKEVQAYYEKGMRVPDDVTLLWCDDNWGNIRRLPTPEERKRSGGAGIYYHFDYVGDPRNYKWINTNPISKVWEQMNQALAYGADRIWIVNVGDLKPLEFPIEYFLTFARNPERWGKDQTQEFTQAWATREFGPEHANEIAELMTRYSQYNGRRKPELLEPETFSLTSYNEAARIESEWKTLAAKAESLQKLLPQNQQDAYFELLLYPIKASAIVNEMYIAAGRNHLYARQGRASANAYAAETRRLFQADAGLAAEYNHSLANGKWNHMMDQTHIGYTYWQQPPVNAMPAVTQVQPLAGAQMGVALDNAPSAEGPKSLSFDPLGQQVHTIEIFNQGSKPFHFEATADQPWIELSATQGEVQAGQPIEVRINWDKASDIEQQGSIRIKQQDGQQNGTSTLIQIRANHAQMPAHGSESIFTEADGYVSIEAEHYSRATPAGEVHWNRIPEYGATLSGMSVFPVTAPSTENTQPRPTLEYAMNLNESGPVTVEAILGPTLNFVPGRGLRFALWFDDQSPVIVDALADRSDATWSKVVSDNMRRIDTKLSIDKPGIHTLKIGMVDPGIVLEKLIVSAAALKPSYLGPPESPRIPASQALGKL